MAQVKIFGVAPHLQKINTRFSDVIHECVVEALQFPPDKRAHRFFPMALDDLVYPAGRSDANTILEFSPIKGGTAATKKRLVRLLFEPVKQKVGIDYGDMEICIQKFPAGNRGFRDKHGDEIKLDYKIEV